MRSPRQFLLLVPILLVGAMLAVIALLPRELADAALWWITGLSGLSILAYLLLAKPWGQRIDRAPQRRRRGSGADGGAQR